MFFLWAAHPCCFGYLAVLPIWRLKHESLWGVVLLNSLEGGVTIMTMVQECHIDAGCRVGLHEGVVAVISGTVWGVGEMIGIPGARYKSKRAGHLTSPPNRNHEKSCGTPIRGVACLRTPIASTSTRPRKRQRIIQPCIRSQIHLYRQRLCINCRLARLDSDPTHGF